MPPLSSACGGDAERGEQQPAGSHAGEHYRRQREHHVQAWGHTTLTPNTFHSPPSSAGKPGRPPFAQSCTAVILVERPLVVGTGIALDVGHLQAETVKQCPSAPACVSQCTWAKPRAQAAWTRAVDVPRRAWENDAGHEISHAIGHVMRNPSASPKWYDATQRGRPRLSPRQAATIVWALSFCFSCL